MRDTYILRLANTVYGNEQPRLSANKDQCFIRIPNFLRDKGKCRVSVIDIEISLKNGSGTSVVPANTHLVAIRSNIPMLGHSNENNGTPNILGTGIISPNENAVNVDSSQALSFTCPQLPDEVHLERMCYDPNNNHNLIAADNFTTNTVPFQVDLQLEFFEDDH
jgi:hypothetical protein